MWLWFWLFAKQRATPVTRSCDFAALAGSALATPLLRHSELVVSEVTKEI
jgi:hypothetical protein